MSSCQSVHTDVKFGVRRKTIVVTFFFLRYICSGKVGEGDVAPPR